MFKKIEKDSFYYGFPIALLTTKDSETGEDNITPISSTWTLDQSVVIGIGLNSRGFLNLQAGSDLTLNLADQTLWKNVEQRATRISLTIRRGLNILSVQTNLNWVVLPSCLERTSTL